jgi:predicted nucleotide-binding protein
MAVYWMLKGGSRSQVSWKMAPLTGDMISQLASLNDEAAKRADIGHFGTIIDGQHIERPQPPPTTFLIHGHDHAGVTAFQDIMSQLLLPEPIVMKDQLIAGATLPEKFEQLAGTAALAIALLTPDDLGGAVTAQLSATQAPQTFRARQNAWLEIGWFWGRLGRDHIMLLVKGDIEIPTDLRGLEYYSYHESVAERMKEIRQFYRGHGV